MTCTTRPLLMFGSSISFKLFQGDRFINLSPLCRARSTFCWAGSTADAWRGRGSIRDVPSAGQRSGRAPDR